MLLSTASFLWRMEEMGSIEDGIFKGGPSRCGRGASQNCASFYRPIRGLLSGLVYTIICHAKHDVEFL